MEETLQVIEWEETFEFDKDPFSARQSIPVNETASETTADETQRKRGKKRRRNSRKNIEKPRSKKTNKVSFPRLILTFRPVSQEIWPPPNFAPPPRAKFPRKFLEIGISKI